jgi:hypothetical protein
MILELRVWYNYIMAILPVPERGQPLDVTYIYQIVKAVNDLSTQASTSVNKYVTVDTPNAGKQSVKTSEARVIGGYVRVTNGESQTAGSSRTFSYSFPTEFKFVPIVTATPVSIGNSSDAGKDVVVTLSSVTTSSIEGSVKFNLGGITSVGINLIAIGIPN